MLTIDELQQLRKENVNRVASLVAAVNDLWDIPESIPENYTITLGVSDVKELHQLMQSLIFSVSQSEIISSQVLENYAMTVINIRHGLTDKEITEPERMEAILKLVDAAILFLPPLVKDYIEAKKKRILHEKGKGRSSVAI